MAAATPLAVGVLLSVLLLLGLLLHGRVATAVLFTAWGVAYWLLGLVPEAAFLQGYTNSALVTLLVLMLVSLALERSPLVASLSRFVTRGGSDRRAVWRLSAVAVGLSSFLNNTAVVGGLLGVVTRQSKVPASRLLIPLSYASILGGVVTLVGTSTNLVVNSLAVRAGLPALGMFQFTPVGLSVAVVCVGVLVLTAHWLPVNAVQQVQAGMPYFLEAQVLPGSPLVGRSIEANGLRSLDGLYLMEIVRGGRLLSPVGPEEVLQAQDWLIFTGEVTKVQALQAFAGLEVFGGTAHDLLTSNLVEVVLTYQSELVNSTLREVDFRTLFDAGVVGIRRGDRRLTGQLGHIELRVGDCLLLAVGSDFWQRKNLERNFHVLSDVPLRPALSVGENRLVMGGFALVIGLSTLSVLPLLYGLLLLLGVLLASRILTPGELRRRFPFDLWLVVGSSLAIAEALDSSGASTLIADSLHMLFSGHGVWGALLGVYMLTWILTELVTNNAAAALAFPIGLSTAQAFGVNPMPFVMVVAYAASASFLLPFGYQTHLMVYSPGRYRTVDFLRMGWPVALAYAVVVLALVPVFFPF